MRLARQARGGLISVREAATSLNLGRRETATLLARLQRRGWLKRARRSLYLVLPIESSSGESAIAEDPWILARAVYSPCYIGGWSAAEHWGLTDQIFRAVFVVTGSNVRQRRQRILNTGFHLIRVANPDLEGTVQVWRGRERIAVSDRERTIADALRSPDWVGGIRHLAEILMSYCQSPERNLERVLWHLTRMRSGAGIKRLGFLIEALLPEESSLIESALARRTAGLVRLDPRVKVKGKLNKRWGLWINTAIK